MAPAVLSQEVANANSGQWFRTEASQVLGSLRNSVAAILSDLGNFSQPAEVQRNLALDKTLSRQIYKLACTAEPLGAGSVVPSRTSIGRFLETARERGVGSKKLTNVSNAYEAFEKLIETHAGDRVTFNSMISSAIGADEDWLAADIQHRRNAFRAMSHAMGVQAKTRLTTMIVNELEVGAAYSVAAISGFIGLRVLRALQSVRVDGLAVWPTKETRNLTCEPLGLSDEVGGNLLAEFSSKPLPTLRVRESSDQSGNSREVLIDQPQIGNTGSSTLMFGSLYRRFPPGSDPLGLHVTTGKPTEVLLFDVLTKPGLAGGSSPKGSSILGFNERFSPDLTPLEGKFDPELVGKGPTALATPEVPRYVDMLRAVAAKLDWDLEQYNAWRIRVEFPLYQSTVTMRWSAP